MPRKLADLRKVITGKGPRTAAQARKLARVAVTTMAPDAIKAEENLAAALENIVVAEHLRGESDAARAEALKVVGDMEQGARKR